MLDLDGQSYYKVIIPSQGLRFDIQDHLEFGRMENIRYTQKAKTDKAIDY